MSAIEAWAEDEFRSTNGQLQWIIAEALRKAGRLPKKKKAASKKTKEEVDLIQIGGEKKDEENNRNLVCGDIVYDYFSDSFSRRPEQTNRTGL